MLDAEDEELILPPSAPMARLLLRLKEEGRPITLTIRGGTEELPVDDEESFALLLGLVDRLDMIATVRERLREKDVKYVSLEEAKEFLRKKKM